jgi:hypothetical protein
VISFPVAAVDSAAAVLPAIGKLGKGPQMSFRIFKRLCKHLAMIPSATRRYFPIESLRRIEKAIAQSEEAHSGQLRFVVEGNLDAIDIFRKKTGKKRAIEIFSQLRVWDTEANNGVLIYLLLADHDFEILGDRGIHHHIGEAGWERISQEMEKRFRKGKFEAGVLYGIEQIGEVLAQHYPAKDNQRNELPNTPIIM